MRRPLGRSAFCSLAFTWALSIMAAAQVGFIELTHPAIQYATKSPNDPVAELIRRNASGKTRLDSDGQSGYLRSILHALDVPVTSQIMIYSPQFERLPPEAKEAIDERLWRVLSGSDKDPKYGRLSPADGRAIIEILRDTKADLPGYFK